MFRSTGAAAGQSRKLLPSRRKWCGRVAVIDEQPRLVPRVVVVPPQIKCAALRGKFRRQPGNAGQFPVKAVDPARNCDSRPDASSDRHGPRTHRLFRPGGHRPNWRKYTIICRPSLIDSEEIQSCRRAAAGLPGITVTLPLFCGGEPAVHHQHGPFDGNRCMRPHPEPPTGIRRPGPRTKLSPRRCRPVSAQGSKS